MVFSHKTLREFAIKEFEADRKVVAYKEYLQEKLKIYKEYLANK